MKYYLKDIDFSDENTFEEKLPTNYAVKQYIDDNYDPTENLPDFMYNKWYNKISGGRDNLSQTNIKKCKNKLSVKNHSGITLANKENKKLLFKSSQKLILPGFFFFLLFVSIPRIKKDYLIVDFNTNEREKIK